MSDTARPTRPGSSDVGPQALLDIERLIKSSSSLDDFVQALLPDAEQRLLVRCAVPRRFSKALVDAVLRSDADVDENAVSFERLIALEGVSRDSGRDGWFFLSASIRATAERAWQDPTGAPDSHAPGPEGYRSLSAKVAQWFEDTGGWPEEVLFNRLGAGSPDARGEIRRLFAEAERTFNLAQCESLLQMLSDHDRAGRLDAELAEFRTTALGLLAARQGAADDYFRSARYLERASLREAFEQILIDPVRHILLLHGPGGQGKTMFLRWLSARFCLPRRIPMARVDFDFLDTSESGLKPRFFFGKLAEQLDAQIPGAVFGELLNMVADMRRRAISRRASPTAQAAERTAADDEQDAAEEQDVIESFSAVIEEKWRGSIVLVFDTLEEGRFRHNIDLHSIVEAVENVRRLITERSARATRVPPRIVLVLSGRHPLQDHYPEVMAEFGATVLEQPVEPFDRDESKLYLMKNRGLKDDLPAFEVAIKRSAGSPFKLALYADVLTVNPRISAEELDRRGDIDVLYLVERVLKRIPDFTMRWVLRYGVLVRSLTRCVLEEVLGPHLIRAMQGDRRYDDPAIDKVDDEEWSPLWQEQDETSRLTPPEYDVLWNRLRNYAGTSSWISTDRRAVDALAIQPVVSHPLRRVLRAKPVFQLIHQDAIAALRADLPGPDQAADDRLAALTYHEFQSQGSDAAPAWRRLLHEYASDAAALRSLAFTVLSEDLVETEAGSDAPPLVPRAVTARAYFELARVAYRDSADAAGEQRQQQLNVARQQLRACDALQIPVDQLAIPAAIDAALRWNLADGKDARETARAALVRAEASLGARAPSVVEWNPLLLALQSAFSQDNPERANQCAERRAMLAQQAHEAAIYADAVDWTLSEAMRRGAIAQGMKTAATSLALLEQSEWSDGPAVDKARERLSVRLMELEAAAGWPSGALANEKRRRKEQEASPSVLLARSRIALAAERPQSAGEWVAVSRKLLEDLIHPDETARGRHDRPVMLLNGRQVEGMAESRLMNFSAALDALQDVVVRADALQEREIATSARLEKARIYLQEIGDLRQAAEHLGDGTTVATESPELRLRHLCLTAELHSRRGLADNVDRAILQAEALLVELPKRSVGRQVATAISVLSIRHTTRHLHHLGLLRDALKAMDSASARLSSLAELGRAATIDAVPAALSSELVDLVEDVRAPESPTPDHEHDRFRLQVHRVELLRVLGLQDRARIGLQRGAAPEKFALVSEYRDVAQLADRLDLRPGAVLPPDWLERFSDELKSYGTLVGVALLEQGEREFQRGSSATARDAAIGARSRFGQATSVRSRYDRRLLLLEAALAREAQKPDQATELEARAAKISEELGEPSAPASSAPLVDARADAWSSQLGAATSFGVSFDASDKGMLLSWSNGAAPIGRTPRPLPEDLRGILSALQTTPLGGQASSPLRHLLIEAQPQPGVRLGQWLLPAALAQAITARLAASPAGAPPDVDPIELIVASSQASFHAVPWELTVVSATGQAPVVFQPNVRFVTRTTEEPSPRTRVQWAQRALSIVLDMRVLADGHFGPLTARAIQKAQEALHLPNTGVLDANTRRVLRDAVRAERTAPPPMRVLLLQSTREEQIAVQRGHSAYGVDMFRKYKSAGIQADILSEADPKRLSSMLASGSYGLIHVAAPIVESRSGGELSVQLGTNTRNVSVTELSAPSLARILKSASHDGTGPMVLLDVPRPPSLEEALRQLILRNVFAAQLFSLAALPAVIAAGLSTIDEQLGVDDSTIEAVQTRAAPGDFAAALRRPPPPPTRAEHRTLEDALSSTCVALFARDPELGPDDLAGAGVI